MGTEDSLVITLISVLFLYLHGAHRDLHSFPTRRSSDLGATKDVDGELAYVLTLRAREQDIRRERATSNICTNQGLMALAAAVYLSLVGRQGLRKVAELCYHRAHYAAAQIAKLPGYQLLDRGPFF